MGRDRPCSGGRWRAMPVVELPSGRNAHGRVGRPAHGGVLIPASAHPQLLWHPVFDQGRGRRAPESRHNPVKSSGGRDSMTQYPDLFAALAAPFESHELKLRMAQNGRQLAYITARTAMNRLDNVLGPENWWDEYVPGENSVLCRLTVRLPDGSILTKADAGGYAGMPDSGDDDKSGFSDSFNRAAATFG